MKTSVKIALVAALVPFFLVACSTKDDPAASISQTELTKSGLNPSSPSSSQLVTPAKIPGILKSYLDPKSFSSIDRYDLIVISEGGYNLIYVVNFEEGGWVLVSGILRGYASPILGFSYDGSFDPDVRSPEAAFWLEATKQTIAKWIAASGR